jgi:drug/metabolite transporter (DMT)-like permease
MFLWIYISLAAAFVQAVRTALQKSLKKDFSNFTVTFARYVYGLPFALIYLYFLINFNDAALPALNNKFISLAVIAGVSQIIATILLVALFAHRNFVVGNCYARTEAIQAAIFGVIMFQDMLSFFGVLAIILGTIGVIFITVFEGGFGFRNLYQKFRSKPAMIGIGSGFCFAISGVTIRHASLSLQYDNFLISAAFTLCVIVFMQMILMFGYLLIRRRDELLRIFKFWKLPLLVGITSILGSIGWFTAMTLQNAAYVKIIGQVEIIFALLISYKIFDEELLKKEALGILLIMTSVILLVFA